MFSSLQPPRSEEEVSLLWSVVQSEERHMFVLCVAKQHCKPPLSSRENGLRKQIGWKGKQIFNILLLVIGIWLNYFTLVSGFEGACFYC